MASPEGARWRTPLRSTNGGECFEVADNLVEREGVVFLRDSKNRGKGMLALSSGVWQEFVDGIRNGDFGS